MSGVAIPLKAERLPTEIEADVRTAPDMHAMLFCRQLDVDLKEALHDLASFLVARIESELTAALATQRSARQLVARSGD